MIFDTIRGRNIEESEMYGVRIGVNPASPHWGIRRFAAPSTTLLPHHLYPCLPVNLWLYLHPCIHICHLDFINNSFFFNSPLLHIYPASCPLRPFLSPFPLSSLSAHVGAKEVDQQLRQSRVFAKLSTLTHFHHSDDASVCFVVLCPLKKLYWNILSSLQIIQTNSRSRPSISLMR